MDTTNSPPAASSPARYVQAIVGDWPLPAISDGAAGTGPLASVNPEGGVTFAATLEAVACPSFRALAVTVTMPPGSTNAGVAVIEVTSAAGCWTVTMRVLGSSPLTRCPLFVSVGITDPVSVN
jgi:hypothetical protein